MNFPCVIADFHSILPRFSSSQEKALEWLISAHCKSETRNPDFRQEITNQFLKVGCKSNTILSRGHEISDFLHENWHEMEIYRLDEFPNGVGIKKRQEKHQEIVDSLFERFYEHETLSPTNLVHVTCTGYASPSGAQKIVSKRGWGENTQVTHLYHMGCYASIPALRVSIGFQSKRTDLVHTEVSTLQMNPNLHEPAQLVVQTLFADGFIKYSLFPEHTLDATKPHFKILSIHEKIIPETTSSMAWLLTDWGFQLFIAKEIPLLIRKELRSYLKNLAAKANLCDISLFNEALFAIHPGGPKILDQIQQAAQLNDDQFVASRSVLKHRGNMSSATLPHIWESILKDPQVPSGKKIVSLAFGPGLTIAGAILEKRGGSCGS